MTAHTPGPWVLSTGGHAAGVVFGGPPREMHTGSLVRGQVASACLQEWMGGGEREANARLIAAAPDLLAALEAVMAAHRFNVAAMTAAEVHSVCFNAIAKAKA